MRLLIFGLALLAATPAAAQDAQSLQLQIDSLRLQQQIAQQRAIDQANQLMSMELQMRVDQAATEAELRRLPTPLPQPPYPSATPRARLDASQLPSIPDAALAASNQRVRDAAQNRR